jgi:excinuclease ABC subunit A
MKKRSGRTSSPNPVPVPIQEGANPPSARCLSLRGARQNNLRGIDLELMHGRLTVVTGVSGAGKSSLVFDTLYAEGQRRYVETFSPYARQFLDRLERPAVDSIDGLLPAVAVDSSNPVRNSRSTVGTATELVDHLRLLFARAARAFCPCCGEVIEPVTATRIATRLREHFKPGERAAVCFPVSRPEGLDASTLEGWLAREGYTRIQAEEVDRLWVVQDRLRPAREDDGGRLVEALELALGRGRGEIAVWPLDRDETSPLPFRTSAGCAGCNFTLPAASPALFSFNSPAGACAGCRGFGRVMGVDLDLVIPDARLTLRCGAVKPWQTKSFRDCLSDLQRHASKSGLDVDLDLPWVELPEAIRRWVIEGDGKRNGWYGINGFFRWLEGQSYKMHIRVLLSKYRAYSECPDCSGSRLRREALWWRIGSSEAAARALDGRAPAPVRGPGGAEVAVARLPGLALHDLMALPIARLAPFLHELELPAALAGAVEGLLNGLRSRVDYLADVGLGYLSLDRQARTLSGGEIQRIHLTTALGTGLVNTLFLLDEPSIGLHPQDVHRVVEVMQRLRDAGNTLVVVDHDPAILAAADAVVDLGPGPGDAGGQVMYSGPVEGLLRVGNSLTADYFSGRRQVAAGQATARAVDSGHPCIHLEGVRAHTLKNVSVSLPLGRLVVVAGVSGSGKSTLIEDVLHPALQRSLGQACPAPGAHAALRVEGGIDEVVLVDQSPIGRTTRSNPVSYVGAWDRLRARFAATPLARERGWTAGRFSFNAGEGRCAVCGGSGHEHVEMQFLADVYLRCPACDGRRFRAETLEVQVDSVDGRRLDVAAVLDLTVSDAARAFADDPAFLAALEPLMAVGLDYLKLGQPVPTLSAGEAQRLKLAGVLAATTGGQSRGRRILYLLDEPTSGLHCHDTARLLAAIQRLVDAGHSVIVIEHDLEVIRAADWVLELGPGAGSAGGEVVYAGSVQGLVGLVGSATGQALALRPELHAPAPLMVTEPALAAGTTANSIEVRNANEHNLKGLDVLVPRDRFTVVTGVSGSGKSTLAFDILFAEGQRRYLESINAWARRVVQPPPRPEVDAVLGLPPTVAIEQRTSRGGHRSTVATATEVHHFLRLLWTRLGEAACAACAGEVVNRDREGLLAELLERHRGREVEVLAPLVVKRKGIYQDLAAWAAGRGHEWLRVDGQRVRTDAWPKLARHRLHDIELPVARLEVTARTGNSLLEWLESAWRLGNGLALLLIGEEADAVTERVSLARGCRDCGATQPALDPRLFSFSSAMGWCPACRGSGRAGPALPEEDIAGSGEADGESTAGDLPCPVCLGTRLCAAARAVRVQDMPLDALARLDVTEARKAIQGWRFHGRARAIAEPIVGEVLSRLDCLERLGLGYLTLDRGVPTLSGGEAQRIRLAAQLGSKLQGVCYVLDEPTIGLHPRDNDVLIACIEGLRDAGNTVVVVEHDEATIRRADHLIDLGPGAGSRGGTLVAAGRVEALTANPDSLTGRCLTRSGQPVSPSTRALPGLDADAGWLRLHGASLHNLAGVDVSFPLGAVNVVTGVSGSGKSSLVRGVLGPTVKALLERAGGKVRRKPVAGIGCEQVEGHHAIERMVEVDQSPIGRTPRSCPATYLGVFDDIRRIYAQLPEARLRGYGPQRFSFNLKEGRCPECEGQGVRTLEMSFLPAAALVCEACSGGRYAPATCEVTLRGLSIAALLGLPVSEAREHLAAWPRIAGPLALLEDVGLGYLSLGQPSPTLSGGEAQRLKLVTELASGADDGASRRKRTPHTLYLLDEPTVGLHMADVSRLVDVLDRLAAAGHTVVVVEHNLDLIARADWVIDLGPESGARGGRLVFAGSPRELARQRGSQTGRYLKPLFAPARRATTG